MFKHLTSYSFKIFVRDKEGVAFGLFFPLAFSLIYLFVFSGLLSGGNSFESIPVAMVFSGNNSEISSARNILGNLATETEVIAGEIQAPAISPTANENDDNPFIHYVAVSDIKAQQLVANNQVAAIINVDNTDHQLAISMELAPSAVNNFSSSILYSALSSFTSINAGAQTALAAVSDSDQPLLSMMNLEAQFNVDPQAANYIVAAKEKKGTSSVSIYFYACLAYLCIFFMSIGTHTITSIEPKYDTAALRSMVSPVPKYQRFLGNLLSFSLPCFIIIYLILGIYYYNGVPLGNDWGRILLLMSMGLLVGLLSGSALASITKAKSNILNALFVGIPLIFGALSGLMSHDLKFFVDDTLPWFNKVNPVALIHDALFALNNYPTYEQFNQNIMTLFLMVVILFAITLIGLRRPDYESL